jgi:hypothetical protein
MVHRLIDLKLSVGSREYAAFCGAIATIYYRPFAQSYYGHPLGDDIVPVEFRKLHDDLGKLRHTTAAHTDATPEPGPTGQPQNAVYLHQSRFGRYLKAEFSAGRHTLKRSSLGNVMLLTAELSKKANYRTKKIVDKYKRSKPQEEGDFILNVENDTSPMWMRLSAPPDLLSDEQ